MPRLGREELGSQGGAEEAALDDRAVEAQEIADGDVCAAVRPADRGIGVDVAAPPDDAAVFGLDRLHAFGDLRLDDVHAKEPRPVHPGPGEDVLGHVLAVGESGRPLDHETEQHVADVAVAATFPRREVGRLPDELRQVVGRLDDRVVGSLEEEILVAFAGLLVGVVGNSGSVGQQVVRRDRRRDAGLLEPQVVDHRGVQRERAVLDELQRRHRREQLGDRRGVETGLDGGWDAPRATGVAESVEQQLLIALPDADGARELVLRLQLTQQSLNGSQDGRRR